MEGYIKLSRRLLSSDIWFKPPLYLKVWIYLLCQASHQDYGTLRRFLSCLYGSQRTVDRRPHPALFLSCLYGSQHAWLGIMQAKKFLSCLYGSQRGCAGDAPKARGYDPLRAADRSVETTNPKS